MNCGSWLRLWLDGNPERKVFWVCADYTKGAFGKADEHSRAHQVSMENLNNLVFSTVHVCRSGCWTPPWTDYRFVNFIERGKFEFVETLGVTEPHDWDPMEPRWTRREIKRAREHDPASKLRARKYRQDIEAMRAEHIAKGGGPV